MRLPPLQLPLLLIAAHSALAFRGSVSAARRPLAALRASLRPPSTFRELVGEMQRSVVAALEDNYQVLEVQAPAVGQRMLGDLSNTFMPQSVSVALAAELGQHIAETTSYKKVAVLHPQEVETMAVPRVKWKWPLVQQCRDDIDSGVQLVICCGGTLATLKELEAWLDEGFTMPFSDMGRQQLVDNFTYDNISDYLEATKNVVTSERRLILFNMFLDDVRDALFKSRDVQFRFLSRAYPAFLMASYQVAASTDKHPFYTLQARGLLMRKHPSNYEFYLDHGQQQYTLMETFDQRPERIRLHRRLLSNIGAQGVHDVDTIKQRLSWWEKPTQFNLYRENSDFWRR